MSDQTIEERIDEALLMYRWDTQTVNEDLVLQQYPEKVIQAHTDLLDEAKQALLQLLNKARIEAYKHGLMTGSLPEALGKPIAKDYLAQLTPKENK